MQITDKVVIITGASSGIGTEIAKSLAAEGAKLVLTGRSAERLAAARDQLGDTPVHTTLADVTSPADCQRVVDEAVEQFGTVDVLVNNAGYAPPAPLLDTDEALWDITIDTCLKGVYLMTQAAVRVMLPKGGGTILQISSVAGKNGYPRRTAYCAAKWGVEGFTAALRAELGSEGIRAHTINPGAVATPWWDTANDAQDAEVMERMIQPEEVAEAVRWLLTQPDRIQIDEIVLQTHRSPWEGRTR